MQLSEQVIYKTACDNCSCKCGVMKLLQEPLLSETMDMYFEWKNTWKIFQYYIRQGWMGCKIFYEAIKYIDNNKDKFPQYFLENALLPTKQD